MMQEPQSGSAHTTAVVHAGFIPLTDCAPLVIAKELAFDAAHGIELQLHKDVSWANIRDRAEAGLLDCAIMLAPMPLASTLGLGGRRPVDMIATMATSLNGNAITVSRALYEEMRGADRGNLERGGMAAAQSLASVIKQRQLSGQPPLTFGMVYPFSSHNYDLRYWLAEAGIDPENDVNLVVVPPPLIAGSLKSQDIDGFCVGEPWNSVAVAEGTGVIVATKSELWPGSPEKVLGMRAAYAAENPDTVRRLTAAVLDACAWLDDEANRRAAAEILARPQFVGIAREILEPALTDELLRGGNGAQAPVRDAIIFSRNNANRPRTDHATWMLTQMIRWGQVRTPFDIAAVARAVYRADIFSDAHDGGSPMAVDQGGEGEATFFGGAAFDAEHPLAYLEGLVMRDRSVDLAGFASAKA